MRLHLFVILLGAVAFFGRNPLPAQSTFATPSLAAERAKLLDGVKTIPRLGAPGPVVAYGAHAFPLLTVAHPEGDAALAAASTMGKGRVVIFGHNGYLGGEKSAEGDLERLLLNAVHWCSGKEKPRVGIKGAKSAGFLEGKGVKASIFDKPDQRTLREFDVVIYDAQRLTDPADAAALQEYIDAGGGFISGITGWAFAQTSGQEFATGFRGNDLLAPAGLGWTAESIGSGPIVVPADSSPALNASTAIALLTPQPGAAPAPTAQIHQAARTIGLALAAMPAANRPAYQRLVARALASVSPVLPTAENPLDQSRDEAARAAISLHARLARFLAPADVKPHPSAATFPGRVAPEGRPISKVVNVDPAIPGWQSTGLFADAGARITLKLPPELAAQGYAVRIGCHTDQLYKREQWKRIPEITTAVPLLAADTTVASAYGGLIYVVVPDKAKQSAPFEVSIAGGVESPHFVLGQTTDAQWQQQVQSASPWAELACPGLILSVPIAAAREIQNPTELMQFWQRVIEAQDDLSSVAAQRRRPERIVPDVQISAGYMHSGYPIMIHLPQVKELTTYDGGNVAPGWGFYHELGHNHQRPEWTPEGTTEVTCNLFSLYIFEHVLGRDKTSGHTAVTPKAQQEHWLKHQQRRKSFSAWKTEPFLALTSYIQLIDAFGFDTLKKVLRSYQGTEFGPKPKTEAEKRDQWMIRYSKIAGKNLGPFFDAWAIPVSDAAKAQIADLPAWMPKGLTM